jgi:hypothetical protein
VTSHHLSRPVGLRRPDEFLQTTIEYVALSASRLREASEQADLNTLQRMYRGSTPASASSVLYDPDTGQPEYPRHHPDGPAPVEDPTPPRFPNG